MDPQTSMPASATTTISLTDVGDRYLNHYQKLFDILAFTLASSRKSSEQDYDEFVQQVVVMPKNPSRLPFDKAKDASEQWVFKHVLAEAVGSVVPLLEDCRTVCTLCDYKVSGKNDPAALQALVGTQRQQFFALPLEEKFAKLQKDYGVSSDLQAHVTSLLEAARALLNTEGFLGTAQPPKTNLTIKIRSLTIVQTQAPTQQKDESILSLARRMGESSRTFKPDEKIAFTKAEQVGALITMTLFLGSMLQSVQAYAKKTGAASN